MSSRRIIELLKALFAPDTKNGLWPCRACGAERAPTYVEKEGRVVSCGNCMARARNEHLESEHCWCEPTCTYRDPRTLKEVWIHREWQ